jgi:hypothetical protein
MLGRPIPVDAALAGERVIHEARETRAGTVAAPAVWQPIKQALIICTPQDAITGAIAFRNKNHPALRLLKRIPDNSTVAHFRL